MKRDPFGLGYRRVEGQCSTCGRWLAPRADGLTPRHRCYDGREEAVRCGQLMQDASPKQYSLDTGLPC